MSVVGLAVAVVSGTVGLAAVSVVFDVVVFDVVVLAVVVDTDVVVLGEVDS
jgi:hypothetical protein